MKFSKLEEIFHKYLSLESDPDFLRIVMATVIANRLDTVPVWLMVIGSASSGKSEILSSLEGSDEIFPVSLLTTNALVSGVDPNQLGNNNRRGRRRGQTNRQNDEPSLLPALDGKVAIIKDASTFITIHPAQRSFIFSQLRAAYDGVLEKNTGLGRKVFRAKFGMIVAATPVIEHYRTFEQSLGERFLYFRPNIVCDDDIWEKVKATRSDYSRVKEILKGSVKKFLDSFTINSKHILFPDRIQELAEQLAILRTEVIRDSYTKEIVFPVEPGELPIRVAKQMAAIYTALAKLVNDEDAAVRTLRRLARNSIPLIRNRIIRLILSGYTTQRQIARALGVSEPYAKRCIEDMELLGIIAKTVRPKTESKLNRGVKLTLNDRFKSLFAVKPA